jgi:hypothetical protein
MADETISDVFERLFLGVEKETNQKEGNRYSLWSDWYSNWIDLFKWLIEINEEKYSSLFVFRLYELNKQLLWIRKCVYSGAYHTAIRELRFVLESFIQAYYIDKEHLDSEMKCKLEIIKEIDKLIGAKLIDNTDLKNKKEMKDLYSELSKYIHSSYEELELLIKEGKIHTYSAFVYDNKFFSKCYDFTNKVMDSIMFIILSFEKRIIKKVQEDELMMKFLIDTDCKLSLRLLK